MENNKNFTLKISKKSLLLLLIAFLLIVFLFTSTGRKIISRSYEGCVEFLPQQICDEKFFEMLLEDLEG